MAQPRPNPQVPKSCRSERASRSDGADRVAGWPAAPASRAEAFPDSHAALLQTPRRRDLVLLPPPTPGSLRGGRAREGDPAAVSVCQSARDPAAGAPRPAPGAGGRRCRSGGAAGCAPLLPPAAAPRAVPLRELGAGGGGAKFGPCAPSANLGLTRRHAICARRRVISPSGACKGLETVYVARFAMMMLK